MKNSSRRKFLSQASLMSASAFLPVSSHTSKQAAIESNEGEHFSFLFQGDSITDGNRTRDKDWNHVMGHGYAYLIAARLLFDFSTKDFHFLNRGISGNTVPDLNKRWKEDAIDLKPDLISILIGVNDTMHAVNGEKNFTAESFEADYRELLTSTQKSLPLVQMVICEPFLLPVGHIKDKWTDYQRELVPRQQAAKRLAESFHAIYIPLQNEINQVADKYPPADYWLWDGIHPMPNGHELIARAWIREVSRIDKFIL